MGFIVMEPDIGGKVLGLHDDKAHLRLAGLRGHEQIYMAKDAAARFI